MGIAIRAEQDGDSATIARLTEEAFRDKAYSSHPEQYIVDALRRAGQLTISLVATDGGSIVGHVAISPVAISSGEAGWYGLGPISVWPERQGRGIGSALVRAALAELQHRGGAGCVLLGSPAYYGRFGFAARPGLVLPGVQPEYFQALSFDGAMPVGEVRYSEAFDATS